MATKRTLEKSMKGKHDEDENIHEKEREEENIKMIEGERTTSFTLEELAKEVLNIKLASGRDHKMVQIFHVTEEGEMDEFQRVNMEMMRDSIHMVREKYERKKRKTNV